MVAAASQKCLHNAYVRMLRGFSNLEGGQDRLGWLEGGRRRVHASVLWNVLPSGVKGP